MLILALSIITMFGLFKFFTRHDYYTSNKEGVFFGVIIGGLVGLFITLFYNIGTADFYNRVETTDIVATKTDTRIEGDIHGSIFYVKGTFNEEEYYFVMTKQGGIFKQEKLPVSKTVIKETTGNPHITQDNTYRKHNGSFWISLHTMDETRCELCEKDTIYVPLGTIDNNVKWEVF